MKVSKKNLKNIAAGAILVALSGFVPKVSRPAHAASATVKVSGTFSSGLKMTAGQPVLYGVIVPTDANGKVTIKATGGTAISKAFFNGGVQQAGSIKFSAGASKLVDITVAGLKNSLTLGSFGGAKTGTVNLPTAVISGPLKTAQTFKITATKQSNTLNSTTKDLNIGSVVTWNAVQPIGTFSQTLTVTVSF